MRVIIMQWGLFLFCVVSSFPGCADEDGSQFAAGGVKYASAPAASAALDDSPPAPPSYAMAEATKSAPPAAPRAEDAPPAVPRKIIYNAQVTLVVESVAAIEEDVARLVKESGGYVAETNISSYSHMRRQAWWKVRVPVERFDGFLVSVGKLGELQENHINSEDVTQEYYDLEARIKNKQQEEKRLQKHLDESTGKLEDILAVEREISRVRGEIEQMQGRIRYLANVSALSTVTITAMELKDYTPPVSPTFATQIGRTFHRSIAGLTEFGKNLVLVCVAVAPWLPVVFVVVMPLWLIARRRWAARRARTA